MIGIEGIPIIKEGDDLSEIIHKAIENSGLSLMDGDVLVVTHKIVSKAEGRVVELESVKPSKRAVKLARIARKPARFVELALREASSVVKLVKGHLITETHHGWFYSCSGVDLSNVSGGSSAVLLPKDPDESAEKIRKGIRRLTGKDVAVLISDTTGRPLRKGDIDVAIGVSGMKPILDLRGKKDGFGYTLRLKRIAVADELASAAELVMGQSDEMIPVAVIRGYRYERCERSSSDGLKRSKDKDIFLKGGEEELLGWLQG